MKKSEIYIMAQIAVINSSGILAPDKLEVPRELMDAEDLALFVEEQEEKENTNETV